MIGRLALRLRRRIADLGDLDYELGLVIAWSIIAVLIFLLALFLKP